MKRSVWIELCHRHHQWTFLQLLGISETHFLVRTPCGQSVCAAGQCPLQVGKEGTFNHPGHDRWTPHTGASSGRPRLLLYWHWGVFVRHETGWALDCLHLSSQDLVWSVRRVPHITAITTTSEEEDYFQSIDTNKQGKDVGEEGYSWLSHYCVAFILVTNRVVVSAATLSVFPSR